MGLMTDNNYKFNVKKKLYTKLFTTSGPYPGVTGPYRVQKQ